jgi:hypothetical protein
MSQDVEIPFACDLSAIDAEQRARHSAAWETMQTQLQEMIEVETGFMFRYPASEAMLTTLATFIAGERLCCPFFDFGVSVPHGEAVVWLSLTGREGVKDFLRAELNF